VFNPVEEEKVPRLAHKRCLILTPPVKVQSVHKRTCNPAHFLSKHKCRKRISYKSESEFLKERKAGGRVAGVKTMVK